MLDNLKLYLFFFCTWLYTTAVLL